MYDKSAYEFEYTDGTMQEIIDNIIAENVLSQVDSKGHHYQVLTEVAVHKIYDSAITKVNSFIKSSNGDLQWNSKTLSCKILAERKDGSVD